MTTAITARCGRRYGTAAVPRLRHPGRADGAMVFRDRTIVSLDNAIGPHSIVSRSGSAGSRSRTAIFRGALTGICIALLAFLSACSGDAAKGNLAVTGGDVVTYQAENGDRITAKYYSLSDKSLDFVKVTLPGGKEYTLPCVLSASGARYTDDRELVWWTKGDTAQAEKRDESGEWKTLYSECKETGKNK